MVVDYECIDILGLHRVRLIADSKVDKWTYLMDFKGDRSFVRLDCLARDNRKVFTNSVYLRGV